MKIAIIGPGAMGTFLAGTLNEDNEVLLIGRRDIPLHDINITGKTVMRCSVEYSTDISKLRDRDLVILCTKSYDTRDTMETIAEYVHDTYVLSLQNGLNNEEIISEFTSRVLGGITSHGFLFQGPGDIVHTGIGKTIIGLYPDGKSGDIEDIGAILNKGRMNTEISDNIKGHIWKKVIINSGINPITALTGLKNGKILERAYLKELMEKVCHEATAIGRTEVDIPGDPVAEAGEIARSTAENKSSMLQDVLQERRTEIDCITGAVIEVGIKKGMDTQYNRILYELVKARESSYL